jgi:hypothetical protein
VIHANPEHHVGGIALRRPDDPEWTLGRHQQRREANPRDARAGGGIDVGM